jgi:N-acetylglucosamine-6-phosphate deacetylase
MLQRIINGKILSPEPLPENYGLLIEADRIVKVAAASSLPEDIATIDAQGHRVIPGLIDIHIHGGAGHDTMDAEQTALADLARYCLTTGVTSFLPTTTAASSQDVTAAINCVLNFSQPVNGARVLGMHLEGPFLGHDYKGAQPEQHLRMARRDEYQPWLDAGIVKLMTVAPEVEGVLDLISEGTEAGVKFAVGHSSASYETMLAAVERGLTQATHTFNGMAPLHHRTPGVLGAILTDERVYAQIIPDGIHLHPAIVKLVMQAKGVDRTVLITDAIQAAGGQDGAYQLGDTAVSVKDGIARTSSGALAGSTLAMNTALQNAVQFSGLKFEQVLRSATSAAAESIGMADRIGAIRPGLQADLVILDEDHSPQLCMVAGKVVFQR